MGGTAWKTYHRSMDEGLPGRAEIYYAESLNAWLSLQSQPTFDGIVVFFRDISEERLHDALVREQQELLASVQSAVLLATWDLDLVTGNVRYGMGSYPVYGHPLEELRTRASFQKIVHPDYFEPLERAVARSIETGERFVQDVQVIAADGTPLWIEIRAQAVLNEEGVATRMRGDGH